MAKRADSGFADDCRPQRHNFVAQDVVRRPREDAIRAGQEEAAATEVGVDPACGRDHELVRRTAEAKDVRRLLETFVRNRIDEEAIVPGTDLCHALAAGGRPAAEQRHGTLLGDQLVGRTYANASPADAPSSATCSMRRPSTPPASLISRTACSVASRTGTSL